MKHTDDLNFLVVLAVILITAFICSVIMIPVQIGRLTNSVENLETTITELWEN